MHVYFISQHLKKITTKSNQTVLNTVRSQRKYFQGHKYTDKFDVDTVLNHDGETL